MPTNAELIAAVIEAFSTARPDCFTPCPEATTAYGDEEVARAEAVFESRTPDTLRSTDVGMSAGWPEVFLTPSARNYYMPGLVRLMLDSNGDTAFGLDDFLRILSPDCIVAMSQKQKSAIADAVEFLRSQVDDAGHTELINRRLKRLRA